MKNRPLPIGIEFKLVEVTLIPHLDAQKARRVYKKARIGHQFRDFAIESCFNQCFGCFAPKESSIPKDIEKYQPHHIVPLSLGGEVGFSNLALVDPKLHPIIHTDITKKIRKMEEGESRLIELPYMPPLIWEPPQREKICENSFLYCKSQYKLIS